ncbi:unnamed protein product [Oppiella nova]|uniref:Uncharacterized protein n=1 Tax=Oppiella nova TaxID=334625 RepID=A0A7R9MI55_9ACAR|nr:unnamed protein product [Oppiella nova]CAG2176821.1 unnamed protein product [Oppiella nova]
MTANNNHNQVQINQLLAYPTVVFRKNDVLDDIEKGINATIKNIDDELAKLKKAGRSSEGTTLENYKLNAQNLIEMIEENRPRIVPCTQTMADNIRDEVAVEIKRLEGKPTGAATDKIIDELLIEASKLRREALELIDKLKAEGKALEAKGLEKLEALVAKGAEELKKLDETSPLVKKAEELLETAIKDLGAEIKRLEG